MNEITSGQMLSWARKVKVQQAQKTLIETTKVGVISREVHVDPMKLQALTEISHLIKSKNYNHF